MRARLAAVQASASPRPARAAGRDPAEVELLAATKYVPLELMGALAEAGIALVGENTAQALIAKQERWGDAFTWDFIGHLQSRKTKQVLPRVRLIHSVESESVVRADRAPRRRSRCACCSRSTSPGRSRKYGVPLGERRRASSSARRRAEHVVFAGLMTMPPFAERPGGGAALLRGACASWRERLRGDWAPRHEFAALSMGTSQDFEVAVEEGATICRLGGVLYG